MASFFEDFPHWVSKTGPDQVLVRVEEPKRIMVQHLGPSRRDTEWMPLKYLLRGFRPMNAPKPTHDYKEVPWWRLKADRTQVIKVVGLRMWQTIQCRRFDGSLFALIEWELLRDYEPGEPWPDKDTCWGRLWAESER